MSQHISPDEQLSAEFDSGTITPETVASIGDEQTTQLLNQWQQIGHQLRILPVRPVTGLLESVRSQIAAEQVSLSPAVTDASTLRRKTVALLACSVALLCVAVSASTLFNLEDASVANLADADGSLNRQSLDGARPEWGRIVVVSVPDDRYPDVAKAIRETADDQGLSVQMFSDGEGSNTPATNDDQRMDIMVASEATTRQLLKALPARLHGEADDEVVLSYGTISADNPTVPFWSREDQATSPLESGIHDRQELLDMVAESMQSPTLSEQYFGEVFVVLSHDEALTIQVQSLAAALDSSSASPEPRDRQIASIELAVPGTQKHKESRLPALNSDSLQRENALARVFSQEKGKPVLVVFQRRKPAPPTSGSLWQRSVGQSIPTA